MNEGTAIELARVTMKELGVGTAYTIRYRELQIPSFRKVELKASNELIILINPSIYLKAYSKSGIHNRRDDLINEQQYIHRGTTRLINENGQRSIHVKLLQVIPLIKPSKNKNNGRL